MDKQVKKTFLSQDVAVLAGIFAAGAACFLPGEGWAGLGGTILLCGAMMLPFYHHGYRLEGQKGLFRLREISLSRENKDEILAYLEGRADKLDLHPRVQGGALVDVYYRKKDGLMFARYFDYADFSQGVEYPLVKISQEQFEGLSAMELKKK